MIQNYTAARGGASLSFRVLAIILATVTIILGVSAGVAAWRAYDETMNDLTARVAILAEVQAQAVTRPLYDFNEPQVLAVLESLKRDPGFVSGRVFNSDGAVVAEAAGETGAEGGREPLRLKRSLVYAEGSERTTIGVLELAFSRSAALAVAKRMMLEATLSSIVLLLAVSAAVMLAFRRISLPLTMLADAIERLAQGDLAAATPGAERRDEIGAIARALGVFRDAMLRNEDNARQRQAEEHARAARMAEQNRVIQEFDGVVGRLMETVSHAVAEVHGAADRVRDSAAQTNVKSTQVSAAVEQAVASVQAVAASVDDLDRSVRAIGDQMQQTSRVTDEAVSRAAEADGAIAGLSEAAGRIGDVVKLIASIAGQTNLLALNATIEAARAGEAGKGFAVVAGEVKNLANQTAHATEEISRQVAEIQSATAGAVDAIRTVRDQVSGIGGAVAQVSAVADEQRRAFESISANANQAAQGNFAMARHIVAASQDARETGALSERLHGVTAELSDGAGEMQNALSGFFARLRTL